MSGHVPVLLAEVLASLRPRADERHIDGTFGRGGYTRAILEKAACSVLALDRDPEAVAEGQRLAALYAGRLVMVQSQFSDLDKVAEAQGFAPADGVTLDLGVSSPQIDTPERGFSFQVDGPLDMRMSRAGESAADIVNGWSETALADLLFKLGEERRSRAIARAVVRARTEAPITRTLQLAAIVEGAIGRSGPIHPATRTFQALRLCVNRELGELALALGAAERVLKEAGRLVVVTFHSLEDRIVKTFLQERSGRMPQGSRHLPERVRDEAPTFSLVSRKAVVPGAAEIERNPRARSAKLRAAIRTNAPARMLSPALLHLAFEEALS